MSTLDDRLDALAAQFAPLPGVLVAFSGGVDSGVVLAAAVRTLGAARVVAATAVSPSLPAAERPPPRSSPRPSGSGTSCRAPTSCPARGTGANAGDRCAFCKSELVDVLTPLAARLGIADVVTGTNADDMRAGFRPGIRAAAERGAWAPLARAGMTKDDVRAAARRWDLPLADKPAAACLASRIAYGVPVSGPKVWPGWSGPRPGSGRRWSGPVWPSGTSGCATSAATPPGWRSTRRWSPTWSPPELLGAVAGFDVVEVDPRGFRSGSMNELLPDRSATAEAEPCRCARRRRRRRTRCRC